MNVYRLVLAATCAAVFAAALGQRGFAADLQPSGPVTLPAETIRAPEDLSAIGKFGDFLIVGSDEASGPRGNENAVQVLSRIGRDTYEVAHDIVLFSGDKENGEEMDIEGIAVEEPFLYVLGSHSARRSRVKDDKSFRDNEKSFRDSKIVSEKSRDRIYRIKLDTQGRPIGGNARHIGLRRLIDDHPVLKTFSGIPGKENGIDMEGIAVKDGTLYLGFRGPVFREGYVPVLTLDFADPEETAELLFVRLGGRGIRSLARVSDGFLIVAGPMGDGPESYTLSHWDGQSMIPGEGRRPSKIGQVRPLGEIRPPEDGGNTGKAEGLVVLGESEESYDLVIVYDGMTTNAAERFQVPKGP